MFLVAHKKFNLIGSHRAIQRAPGWKRALARSPTLLVRCSGWQCLQGMDTLQSLVA